MFQTIRRAVLSFLLAVAWLKARLSPATLPLRYRDPLTGNDNTLNHYVNKFDDDIQLVFQQKTSRLEGTVTADYDVVGMSKSFDTLGQSEMNLVTGSNQDHLSASTTAGRRWIDMADYDWQDFVNTFDKLKVLEDPTNKYVQAALGAANRTKDRLIISALGGNARDTTGAGNNVVTTYAALPSGQKILHAGTNITMAKVRAGIEIMNANEAGSPEEGGTRTFTYTASQLTILMADTTVSSSDYNTMSALQNFTVDQFMGMTWKRMELLPKTALIRSCYIYSKDAVGLGIGADVKTSVSQRMDKRGLPWQVYAMISGGAVRGQDKGVVEIQCQEP
jgi:hypothetical protein